MILTGAKSQSKSCEYIYLRCSTVKRQQQKMRTMTSLVVCTLVLALALGSADARKKKMKKGCSKDHSLVGKKGKLVTLEHEVS